MVPSDDAAGDSKVATLVQLRSGSPEPSASVFTITVQDGVGADRGLSVTLDASRPAALLIGQSPTCDLRLAADREVSRRHASLEVVEHGIRVVDLGSTNGTFVDRVRVRDAILTGGEILRIGSTVLAIETKDQARAAALPDDVSFGRVLGRSREMRRLYPLCARLAQSNVPVIIEGETGTGKEVMAEAIHEASPRGRGPFVVFDCTTSPPNLVESELFGHERGAFTGAVSTRKGVFEQAHGGTLLIDEIGDLDPLLQPKLLRALERSEIRRVGGDKWIKVDVRILAATRRDLDQEVAAGRFRDDLFHRLAVARIHLPPLCDRHGDVELLARAMWTSLGGAPDALPEHVLLRWAADRWPGNVRSLRNAVARQLALGDLADDSDHHSPSSPAPAPAPANTTDLVEQLLAERHPFLRARELLVAEFEQRYVERVLAEHGGDVTKAAAASGIGRRYFYVLKGRRRL